MKKVSTRAAAQSRNISPQKLTIGLDLGDRNCWYCVVDEAGQIQREQRVRTNAKALQEVFGALPRGRIALEIGTHSPSISRLLRELGHEVIVANARKVRLIGESRKKDDRLDAQTLARLARIDPELLYPVKHRSVQAQADLTLIRAAGWAGAGTNRAGQHGARAGQKLWGAIAQLERGQHMLGPFGVDCDLRRWGLKLAERGGRNGKKRAIVATARKLAVLLHHLWVSGEVYEPLHNSSPTTMAAAA
jgi:hypothetical protein